MKLEPVIVGFALRLQLPCHGQRITVDLQPVLDFEHGKDKIDLSQLLDGSNQTLAMDDLVITLAGGNTEIGFASGVHTLDSSAVTVNLTLVGVATVSASDFAFTAPSIAYGIPALDAALGFI